MRRANQMVGTNIPLSVDELVLVSGGERDANEGNKDCEVYQTTQNHNYVATGKSRPVDAWFYNTEEEYACTCCGLAYWSAGFFSWSYSSHDWHFV